MKYPKYQLRASEKLISALQKAGPKKVRELLEREFLGAAGEQGFDEAVVVQPEVPSVLQEPPFEDAPTTEEFGEPRAGAAELAQPLVEGMLGSEPDLGESLNVARAIITRYKPS